MKALKLVSNPFDVTGAVAAGLKAIWVDRSRKGWIDQLGKPTHIVGGLDEIPQLVEKLKLNGSH
jgi:2-haloacid dehalogenase